LHISTSGSPIKLKEETPKIKKVRQRKLNVPAIELESSKLAAVVLSPEINFLSIFDTDPSFVRVMKQKINFKDKNEDSEMKDYSN
jgi:hypothetical protein